LLLTARFWGPIISVLREGTPSWPDLFVTAVFAVLGLGAVASLWTALWMVLGRERVDLVDGTMSCFRGLLSVGVTRTYALADLRGLHIPAQGGVAFTVNGHMARLLRDVDDQGAARVLELLGSRAPRTLSPGAA
jgi:hypothetical protein